METNMDAKKNKETNEKINNLISGGGSTLEENRIIYINGVFDEGMAKEVFVNLMSLELKNPTKDILLIIDSYGGYVHSFLAIHDAIKLLRCDVAALCIGKCMSCGQMLLISATKGKRFSTKNSRILMHEVASFTGGKLTDMEIDLNESKALKKILEELILEYTSIKSSELKRLMERDSYMSPEEAKELGIIDDIVISNKDLYKRLNL